MSPQTQVSFGISRRLGEMLVASGLLTQEQLKEALDLQRTQGAKLGTILIQRGYIEEDSLLEFLGKQCGIVYLNLSKLDPISEDTIHLVPESIARRHNVLPICLDERRLTVAMTDPLNVLILDDLKMMTGLEIVAVLASESEIQEAISRYYQGEQNAADALEEILQQEGRDGQESVDVLEEKKDEGDNIITLGAKGEDAPIIQMVNVILSSAIKAKASDIHIEPLPKSLRVRFRIDGVLHPQASPPRKFLNAIVSRLKIMANLDIAERRVPQDGRIKLKIQSKEIDLRASFLPCAVGEKVVMRILDSSGLKVTLDMLGMEPENMALFAKRIKAPNGIILITGPTGSGKSTTLYSAISSLNTPDTNIVTVEDPVEYTVEGINQVQANNEVGLTFAAALKSFLRQDPDIILVGEVRDGETMNIAVNAALTGHLVFSTLHTNDAPQAITRIGMMGVDPVLTSSALRLVVAQRLVRKVCGQCKETYQVDSKLLLKLGATPQMLQSFGDKIPLARGKGCDNCVGTGYRGRVGIHEMLDIGDDIRELINKRATSGELKEAGRRNGMITLRGSALRKVIAGLTTVEEMLRVTAADVE